ISEAHYINFILRPEYGGLMIESVLILFNGNHMSQEKPEKSAVTQLTDMNSEEFRKYGYQVIDWIADYLSHPERYPVLSQVEPGFLKAALPQSAPVEGEP